MVFLWHTGMAALPVSKKDNYNGSPTMHKNDYYPHPKKGNSNGNLRHIGIATHLCPKKGILMVI